MNRGEIRDELGFVLNFNEGQADQGFTAARLNTIIQRAYERIVHRISQQGVKAWFKKTFDATWEAGEVTFTVPSSVAQKGLMYVRDVTDDEIGAPVLFSQDGQSSTIFWKDNGTLQWGTTGPGSQRTLRFFYYARPESLSSDVTVPALVPEEFHELIVWEAACIARQVADETAPQAWISEKRELMMDLMKFVSKGRPETDIPWVEPRSDSFDWEF